jgi:hypothetical protein
LRTDTQPSIRLKNVGRGIDVIYQNESVLSAALVYDYSLLLHSHRPLTWNADCLALSTYLFFLFSERNISFHVQARYFHIHRVPKRNCLSVTRYTKAIAKHFNLLRKSTVLYISRRMHPSLPRTRFGGNRNAERNRTPT